MSAEEEGFEPEIDDIDSDEDLPVRQRLRQGKNLEARKSSAGYRQGNHRIDPAAYSLYEKDQETSGKLERAMKWEFFQYASHDTKLAIIKDIYGDKEYENVTGHVRMVARDTCMKWCKRWKHETIANLKGFVRQAFAANSALKALPTGSATIAEFRRLFSGENFLSVFKFMEGVLLVDDSAKDGKFFIENLWANLCAEAADSVRADLKIDPSGEEVDETAQKRLRSAYNALPRLQQFDFVEKEDFAETFVAARATNKKRKKEDNSALERAELEGDVPQPKRRRPRPQEGQTPAGEDGVSRADPYTLAASMNSSFTLGGTPPPAYPKHQAYLSTALTAYLQDTRTINPRLLEPHLQPESSRQAQRRKDHRNHRPGQDHNHPFREHNYGQDHHLPPQEHNHGPEHHLPRAPYIITQTMDVGLITGRPPPLAGPVYGTSDLEELDLSAISKLFTNSAASPSPDLLEKSPLATPTSLPTTDQNTIPSVKSEIKSEIPSRSHGQDKTRQAEKSSIGTAASTAPEGLIHIANTDPDTGQKLVASAVSPARSLEQASRDIRSAPTALVEQLSMQLQDHDATANSESTLPVEQRTPYGTANSESTMPTEQQRIAHGTANSESTMPTEQQRIAHGTANSESTKGSAMEQNPMREDAPSKDVERRRYFVSLQTVLWMQLSTSNEHSSTSERR